jgi:hypothetical protein
LIFVINMDSLVSFSVPNMTVLTGRIEVSVCPELTSLGFTSLVTAFGQIKLTHLPKLRALDGFFRLRTLNAGVSIGAMPQLVSVAGLCNVRSSPGEPLIEQAGAASSQLCCSAVRQIFNKTMLPGWSPPGSLCQTSCTPEAAAAVCVCGQVPFVVPPAPRACCTTVLSTVCLLDRVQVPDASNSVFNYCPGEGQVCKTVAPAFTCDTVQCPPLTVSPSSNMTLTVSNNFTFPATAT